MLFQKVIYENLPQYCADCKHLGYNTTFCFENGNVPKPAKFLRPSINKGKEVETRAAWQKKKGKDSVPKPHSPDVAKPSHRYSERASGVVQNGENMLQGNLNGAKLTVGVNVGVEMNDPCKQMGNYVGFSILNPLSIKPSINPIIVGN
ncbi:hypothetical protein Pfo_017393 [Paulownia fortunei]|nr:hypothetical protein Pfo_017393 [Paulownia fortunei]